MNPSMDGYHGIYIYILYVYITNIMFGDVVFIFPFSHEVLGMVLLGHALACNTRQNYKGILANHALQSL